MWQTAVNEIMTSGSDLDTHQLVLQFRRWKPHSYSNISIDVEIRFFYEVSALLKLSITVDEY